MSKFKLGDWSGAERSSFLGWIVFLGLLAIGFWHSEFFGIAEAVGVTWLAWHLFEYTTSGTTKLNSQQAMGLLGALAAFFVWSQLYHSEKDREFEKSIQQICERHTTDSGEDPCDRIIELIDEKNTPPDDQDQ